VNPGIQSGVHDDIVEFQMGEVDDHIHPLGSGLDLCFIDGIQFKWLDFVALDLLSHSLGQRQVYIA
jgi:hypothetical protein